MRDAHWFKRRGDVQRIADEWLTDCTEVALAQDGRKRAARVQYPPRPRKAAAARGPKPGSPAPWTLPRLVVLPVFLALYAYAAVRWGVGPRVLLLYGAASLAAFVMYALDKRAAIAGRRRTPESALHALAVLGGWPGALLAQQLYRHKTAKREFILVFWATVGMNVSLFVLWHSGALGAAVA